MKNLKNLIALVLAFAMILTCVSAFAEYGTVNQHTVEVTSNGTGVHTYIAYQIFKGNLNATEGVLSDIQWGNGVGSGFLAALQADDTCKTYITADVDTAPEVAKVLEAQKDNAAFLKAFADVVAANKGTASDTKATPGTSPNKATLTVPNDGYYCIIDETTTLADGDTASKHMLQVVKDEKIVAKDTVITPDKKILDAQNGAATETKVAADSSAIGDTVTFNVDITVPDTTAYVDHFVFVMNDTLPAGITFTRLTSIKIDGNDLPAANYELTAKTGDAEYATYTVPTDPVAAVGGQKIKVVFKDFKNYVETNDLIGKTITVTYTGVVNDDAEYKATANENEVYFDFSNNPNHDYDGDEPDSDDPTGVTPKSTTRTYTTSLKIKKVDQDNNVLAGAEFTLTGTSLNRTVVTGSMFVKDSETAQYDGSEYEVDKTTKYYKLKDGSYTTQDPATPNMNTTQYDNINEIWRKVTYAFDEVSSQQTTLVVTTDANGVAEFTGLREGTDYTLEETHAPDGYNKIDGTSNITIAWSDPEATNATSPAKDQGGFTLSETGSKTFGITWNETDKQFEVTIQNQSGATLPSTGGIGTTIFYILGSLLVVGAGVILVTKRRMGVEK